MLGMSGLVLAAESEHSDSSFWKDGIFHQTSIDLSQYEDGLIRARIEGEWGEFRVIPFPESFLEWNIGRRLEMLDKIKNHQPPDLAGPHNGIVASHGLTRKDSEFSLNNAVKGMGFLPKPEKLSEIIDLLHNTIEEDFPEKLAILESLYTNYQDIFDLNKQVSLELYSTPEFETHTFLNQMVDPGVSIVFLDVPSYEVRALSQLLHPEDPRLTDYEKQIVEYINLVHSYFHGEFPRLYIAVVYHVIEVFDNSPGRRDALGQKIAP